MAIVNFSIPLNKEELLSGVSSSYVVNNVYVPGALPEKLKEAKHAYREDKCNFILEHFDTYFSVLENFDKLPVDLVFRAYRDLERAATELPNAMHYLLENRDALDEEAKMKAQDVMKMLLYIFIQFVRTSEYKQSSSVNLLTKGRGKSKSDDNFTFNKKTVVSSLNNILQEGIHNFWEHGRVEEPFLSMIADLCYCLLENPTIKQDKDLRTHVFGIFGNLIKIYDYGTTFIVRIVRLVKMYEHASVIVSEGVKLLVEQFDVSQVVHHLVAEAMEWQHQATNQDLQASRFCSNFLAELAALLPHLMAEELKSDNDNIYNCLSIDVSVPLRAAVLSMITEVILNVFTDHNLTEEQKETRDELFDTLLEHTCDVSAIVRSKVIQNIARLQENHAIPLKLQDTVLAQVIKHLKDKATLVRKVAIHCISTFLSCNPYGANLQLDTMEEELARKTALLDNMEAGYKDSKLAMLQALQDEWEAVSGPLKEVIAKGLEDEEEEEVDNEMEQGEEGTTGNTEALRIYLKEKKFEEAFKICRLIKKSSSDWNDAQKTSNVDESTMYLAFMQSIFINASGVLDDLRCGAGMSEEDVQKIKALEAAIGYCQRTVTFLKLIDTTIEPMKELLFTQTVTDMHEAIQFFIVAYHFNINNTAGGILAMLSLMKQKEQERKDAVIKAFKTIFLTTESQNMPEHTATILNRLIKFHGEILVDDATDFEDIVAEWTSKQVIDNAVIDMCWQYVTKRAKVTDHQSRGALEILRMAAVGRRTIITKNIKVVTAVAFSGAGKDDMQFVAAACRLLSVVGREKIDIATDQFAFKLKHTDELFDDLVELLTRKMFENDVYYLEGQQCAIDFVFRACAKPDAIIEKFVTGVFDKLSAADPEADRNKIQVISLINLFGELALKQLGYLDDTVYRELKRRCYVRDMNKENVKKSKTNKRKSVNASASNSFMMEKPGDDSVLEGAQADDADAEFILNILENTTVSEGSFLGQFGSFIKEFCQRPDLYADVYLQGSAVIALTRYMLVSSKFCQESIQLLFTILEKTSFPEVKCSILLHCSDLLTRFPNIVEPWTSKIYERLGDGDVQVRKTALFSLSNLILRDMVRVHSHISEMAVCIVDENQEVGQMSKKFFENLAQKENNLANILPDIFSHLVKLDSMTDENFRYIMQYLFDYVDNNKRGEHLVDRFCCKYYVSDDLKYQRDVTYCLSLIKYNEKALRKLQEKFDTYKHLMHDADIYGLFKQILAESGKNKVGKTDLKPIVTEIEDAIQSIFDVNEEGQPMRRPPIPKSTKKPRKNPASSKKKNKENKRKAKDSESDSEISSSTYDQPKRSRRARNPSRKNTIDSSDSE